ncbi:di-trans,poly-cis-decaprenylcistransferase [Candidatus Micrarchaeota archaeon]|nr:di-trans,poly-cis-decaprenylcistransferase [Candidatus Micrarchaeota archaeon]
MGEQIKRRWKPKQGSDPLHIAIIPDGNRRWARKRRLSVLKGHEKGIDNLRNLMNWIDETEIKYVSLWGFSSENFMRDPREVHGLFKLFNTKMMEIFKEYDMNKGKMKYKIRFIGDIDKFPKHLVEQMRHMEEVFNKGNRQVNILLGYGGRHEILHAVNNIIKDMNAGRLMPRRKKTMLTGTRQVEPIKITEKIFSRYLYTKGIPDPDIVIRTSGEMRLSGFMPWQTVYSELYFSKKLWPDFNKREFFRILDDYKMRKRRFGR